MSNDDNAMSRPPETALVAARTAVPAAPPAPTDPPETWPTSIDVATPEGRQSLVRLAGPPTLTADEAGDDAYCVTGYLLYPAESVDEETGEVSQFTRLALLLDDGRTVATTGPVVIRKWMLILRICGLPSEANPIAVAFSRRKSRRQGRTFHDIELLADF